MKKDYILLSLVGVLFLAASCTDEFETQTIIKHTGDEILFGGRASYELNGNKGATRTIYTGETYTEGDKTLEGINWIVGDQVRIYCPQTVNTNVADYTITANTTSADVEEDADGNKKGKYRYSYLSKSSEQAAALQWGNTSLTHSFYSVYPSPQQYVGGVVSDDDVIKSSTILNGYIPSVQIPKNGVTSTMVNGYTHYTAAPDMKYAYMVARTNIMPNETSESVFLQYMPIATAVEITLTNHTDTKHENSSNDPADQPYEFKLTNITISSADGTPIYGQFKADLSTMQDSDNDNYADKTPSVETVEGTLGTQISIPTLENGTSGNPTVLGVNESITVTVFMLPTVDLNSLKVTITGVEGIRTATIKGNGENNTGFSISAGKKTYIRNLPLTADILPFNLNNWLQFIENDVYVREISIPGTGGAATYALTDENISSANLSVKKEFVAEQLYDLAYQWEQGVRCFEFSVDKSTTDNLGDAKIICSGVQMDMTLSAGVGQVQELLKNNPKEFAMVIITYETAGGWSGTRSPSDFMNQLNTFWSGVKTSVQAMNTTELADAGIVFDTQLYDPSTATVGSARGKLFCIARPTSAHLDYGTDVIDVKAYETAKMNNNNSVGDYNIEAAKRVAFLPSEEIKENWSNLELPNIHSDIMIIHGWGTLKDKWQQRGFTNYSKRGTGDSYTFNFSYDGYTYGSETTAEPGRPFDGAFFHSSNHQGWGSVEPEISTGATGYTVTITPATSGYYTQFEVTSVTSTLGNVSQDGDNYVIDLGSSKPTEDFIITVNYTCSYYRSYTQDTDTDSETVLTRTITPDDLDYNNNVFTLTATASRQGSYNNYSYSYSYSWSGPVNGENSNVGTYYGNLPSTTSTITPSDLTPDFGYDVVVGGTKTATAWVQEWARVSNSQDYYWDNEAANCRDGNSDCTGYYVSYWAPSYAEKLQRATEALTYAREKTKGLVYINSLCGYYVTKDYPSSSAPCSWTDCGYGSTSQGQGYNEIWVLSASSPISGLGGDIAGFAEQINTDFYAHLLNLTSASDYVPGSMGIILLDRVGEDNSKGALIAGLVVSNNFLYELATDPDYNSDTKELSLIDAESEDPQYAPATRGADGEEEVMMVWE